MKRLVLAGSEHVFAHRAELDRMNVFPIPDGDTGTNLALTLRAVVDSLGNVRERSISGVASRIAEAGVAGARGNSGMMFSHFFLGFAEGLDGRSRAAPEDLANAMRRACHSLYRAVEQPVEGTILTVVRETTEEFERLAARARDLAAMARRLLHASQVSLRRTTDLLPALKEANVVDAGAKGFVRFLEGAVALIDGRTAGAGAVPMLAVEMRDAAAAANYPEETDRAYRYCTEFILRGDSLPTQAELAGAVRGFGGSQIITRAANLAKIHLHTDEPESVEKALSSLGGVVELVKAEDMRAQHKARRGAVRRALAIVTDTTCDLPPELVIEHDVTIVPLTVMFGDQSYMDQVDITHEEFLERLVDPEQPLPTTSQPAPADLEQAYRLAAERAEEVLAIFLSGAVSGTLGQAQAVAARFGDASIRVYNSRTASLGLGFKVLRAAELARAGSRIDEIIAELERLATRSGLFITVDTLSYLQRSGRVGKAKAFLGGLLGLKPILSVDGDGALIPVDRVRGREALIPRVLQLLGEEVPRARRRLRMGIAHVACPEVASELARQLRSEFAPDELFIRPVAGVIAAHTGPGAWGVFYQAE